MGRGEPHIGRAKLRSAEPVAELQPDRHEQLDEHDATAAASSATTTGLSDAEPKSSAVPASASMANAPIRG